MFKKKFFFLYFIFLFNHSLCADHDIEQNTSVLHHETSQVENMFTCCAEGVQNCINRAKYVVEAIHENKIFCFSLLTICTATSLILTVQSIADILTYCNQPYSHRYHQGFTSFRADTNFTLLNNNSTCIDAITEFGISIMSTGAGIICLKFREFLVF